MNTKKSNIISLIIIIVAVVVVFFLTINKKTNDNIILTQLAPVNKINILPEKTSQLVPHNKFYKDYMSINVPPDWKISEVTRTFQDQKYDDATGKITLIGKPITEKTGAIEITKGNYSIFISPIFQYEHARPLETISIRGQGAELVMKDIERPWGGLECATVSKMVIGAFVLDNYYTDKSKHPSSGSCNFPTDEKSVWFGSESTGNTDTLETLEDGSRGEYKNEYGIFFDYNTDDVNKLPKKDSLELKQFFDEAISILNTLKFI